MFCILQDFFLLGGFGFCFGDEEEEEVKVCRANHDDECYGISFFGVISISIDNHQKRHFVH